MKIKMLVNHVRNEDCEQGNGLQEEILDVEELQCYKKNLRMLSDLEQVGFEDPDAFKNFCRMGKKNFEFLLDKVRPHIQKKNIVIRESIQPNVRNVYSLSTHNLPLVNAYEILVYELAKEMTIICIASGTLRYVTTGCTYTELMYLSMIPVCTLSLIIPETLEAIYNTLSGDFIRFPKHVEEWEIIAEEFLSLWNFAHCLGAMDGKHISFQPPRNMGSYYFNYKGSHSIVLLALCDAKCRYLYVDVGVNGRVNDAGVFANSSIGNALSNNKLNLPAARPLPGGSADVPYVIVADDAFPLSPNIMKPFPKRGLSHEKIVFNYRLSRARIIVENTFGIWVQRFRILMTKIILPVEKIQLITIACYALHNFLRTAELNDNQIENVPEQTVDVHVNATLGNLMAQQGGNHSSARSREIRYEFMHYFNGVGRVEWQEERVAMGNF